MDRFPQDTPEDLENRFTHHAPKPGQTQRYETIRAMANEFAQELLTICPASRERSLSITKLEEAVFFACGSIARNE